MTNNKDDKITEAGAVELDENELDQVTGGSSDIYTKGDGLKKISTTDPDFKEGIVKDPIRRAPSGFDSVPIKRSK